MALQMSNQGMKKFSVPVLLVAIFAGSIVTVATTEFYSTLSVNLGWVNLAKAVMHNQPKQELLEQAKTQFNLIEYNLSEASYRGLGTVELWNHQPNAAVEMWRAGDVSADWLLAMGKTRYAADDLNGALTYLMGAEALAEDRSDEARIYAGIVCQRTYANPHILSEDAQEYCRRFFSRQSGNLIVNGSFESSSVSGWQLSLSGQKENLIYEFDHDRGQPAPSIVMSFRNSQHSMGLLQWINLLPGTTIRFGAWLRVEASTPEFEARVLHIQYQRRGKSPGNSLLTMSNNTTEWTYFEREFRLPDDADGRVTLLPVLAKGEGKVWIDEVTVTVVDKPQ